MLLSDISEAGDDLDAADVNMELGDDAEDDDAGDDLE